MFTNKPEKHQTTDGWIGVDLDGTLAHYEGWNGRFEPEVIGAPIPLMVERVLQWLREGRTIKIFTARISYGTPAQKKATKDAIQAWSNRHLGIALDVTCQKDIYMTELWDDRCVQIVTNTGMTLDQYAAYRDWEIMKSMEG